MKWTDEAVSVALFVFVSRDGAAHEDMRAALDAAIEAQRKSAPAATIPDDEIEGLA